ncbi:hypothetical protein M231_00124 [Tremella mesenterica]|uniref:Uncharacterized protein n=1 Tax=Tremella mesenterica TaxID=5217 RepID=A0A4Q1BWP2_TREME|nr:hypothetical protein M231_00124 [Tremella mesenterica]
MTTSLSSSPNAQGSLLFSRSQSDNYPRTGILLNAHEVDSSPPRRTSPPSSPLYPASGQTNHIIIPSGQLSPGTGTDRIGGQSSAPISPGGHTPKIRFAPLPDPKRPRSLSTGRNVAWVTSMAPNGDRTKAIAIRGLEHESSPEYEEEVLDETDAADDAEDEDGEAGRGRRWSKSVVSGSWKGTKKLLLVGGSSSTSKDEGYASGAPLKKSVSTGGLMGSSPFRSTSERERRKSMQGGSPARVNSVLSPKHNNHPPEHRRNSSLDAPHQPTAILGSSPTGVRMLNGRIYGTRRAAEREKEERLRREKLEPAFIEWGHHRPIASLGTEPSPSNSGFLEEEGSGMEWVKRRREARKRREAEEREKALREQQSNSEMDDTPQDDGLSSSSSSDSSLDLRRTSDSAPLVTPNLKTADLPPTPIIRVSEASVGQNSEVSSPMDEKMYSPPIAITIAPQTPRLGDGGEARDVFDDEGSGDEEDEEGDGDGEGDDNDFEEDEEEEEEVTR